jgi:protein-L-isoaspartate(D-aspartate) O-methyltransferase
MEAFTWPPAEGTMSDDEEFSELRQRMLAEIAAQAVFACGHLGKAALSARVIDVMAKVPRHEFVPLELRPYAYANSPLPIGFGKSISQPFIVAVMTDLLDVRPTDTVLEIGTGLGYQSAILSELAQRVYTVELIEELAGRARHRLARQGHSNVEVRIGNGCHGWPEHAPFDKVIVTAAPELIPAALLYQLKPGGKMVIPAGLPDAQQLILVDKDANGSVSTREIFGVRFSLLDDTDPD